MKLIVKGRTYDFVQIDKAPNLHIIEMQVQAKKLVPGGLGNGVLDAIRKEFNEFQRAAKAAGMTEKDTELPPGISTPDCMQLLTSIYAFLAVRGAGEEMSLRQALMLSTSDIQQVKPSEVEQDALSAVEETEDPTAPGSGGPATPDGVTTTAATPDTHSNSSPNQ
jgi:hypothetical protein